MCRYIYIYIYVGQTNSRSIGKSFRSRWKNGKFLDMIGPQRSLSILNMSWGHSLQNPGVKSHCRADCFDWKCQVYICARETVILHGLRFHGIKWDSHASMNVFLIRYKECHWWWPNDHSLSTPCNWTMGGVFLPRDTWVPYAFLFFFWCCKVNPPQVMFVG